LRRRSQHTVDAPPPEPGRPLADVLDDVVESLNSLSASVGATSGRVEADWFHPAWTTKAPKGRHLREAVSFFFRRLRRSRRLRYRLVRLAFAWTSLAAAVGAVVWVAFALRGPG
jgi:hypothetical protein